MADQISGILSPFLRVQRIKAAKSYISGRTLDYGCGTGVLSEIVREQNYTGVDIDPESIKIARKRYPGQRFFTVDEFLQIAELEIYDTIACLAVIEHMDSPANLLSCFKNMLAKQGRIVLTTPHPSFDWFHAIGASLGLFSRKGREEHKTLFNRQSIIQLAEKTGLYVTRYQRFLFGANQLAVLEHQRE
jgi:2-polyprenyl-3-methyl-5-hydroxy-6-metoxy-1,4-benzoquinol methylase